jgi:hypothetical protein
MKTNESVLSTAELHCFNKAKESLNSHLDIKAIGPDIDYDNFIQGQVPVYWIASKTVFLPICPHNLSCILCVDRHYEVFVNGNLAVRQRNFFNGDHYLYAQQQGKLMLPFFRGGENAIEIVVRSDPWLNKNHRYYRPMLMFDAHFDCGEKEISVFSDESWRTSTIENWREQITKGGCETIVFERVFLPEKRFAALCGFSDQSIHHTKTSIFRFDFAQRNIIVWNDPPKRLDKYSDYTSICKSNARLPDENVILFLSDDCGQRIQNREPVIYMAEFDDPGNISFAIAASALLNYKLELNDTLIGENCESLPDRNQMALHDYIIPIAFGETQKGINRLKLTITGKPFWPSYNYCYSENPRLTFRYTSDYPELLNLEWHNISRAEIRSVKVGLKISEKINAKINMCSLLENISTDKGSIHITRLIENAAASTVITFAKTIQARVFLRIKSETPGRIYLGYGFDCKHGVIDCARMSLDSVDILEVPSGESSYSAFETRTFRYLDLIFQDFAGPVEISEIYAEEPVFLDESLSEFQCSDKQIEKIFNIACRTGQLCCDELFVDNPEREHTQWADAIYAVGRAGYYVFGEYIKAKKALEEIAMAQQPDGQLPGYAPGAWFPRVPLQCHMSLFALSFFEFYMHTGDETFGRQMLQVNLRMIQHWENCLNSDGLLSDIGTVFVDWGYCEYSYRRGENNSLGILTAINGYYLGVLRSTAKMATFLGENEIALKLQVKADRTASAMRKHLYNKKLGLFIDGIGDALAEKTVSVPANCLAVQYGAAPKGEEETILKRIFSPISDMRFIPSNALFAPKAAEALFENRCEQIAINWFREKYGEMLNFGSDTFWETFQPHASYCQATGCGPAYIFSRYLVGIYPLEPGFRTIAIEPHPGNIRNLKARLTTPFGVIKISWQLDGENINYELLLPPALKKTTIKHSDRINLISA